MTELFSPVVSFSLCELHGSIHRTSSLLVLGSGFLSILTPTNHVRSLSSTVMLPCHRGSLQRHAWYSGPIKNPVL